MEKLNNLSELQYFNMCIHISMIYLPPPTKPEGKKIIFCFQFCVKYTPLYRPICKSVLTHHAAPLYFTQMVESVSVFFNFKGAQTSIPPVYVTGVPVRQPYSYSVLSSLDCSKIPAPWLHICK
jgi:hypothetical protein